MPGRRSARIDCLGGSFWVTPRIFWRWVREGVVKCEAEHPLAGRYLGAAEEFQVSLHRIILDRSCPEHLHEVLEVRRRHRDRI